jgi:hypothetical protein
MEFEQGRSHLGLVSIARTLFHTKNTPLFTKTTNIKKERALLHVSPFEQTLKFSELENLIEPYK